MKKAKLLPLLALLVLLTVPARAAGGCGAVPDGGQWRIARRCPGAWSCWALPDFLRPDAAPAVPDAPANTDSPAPNGANVPAPAVPNAPAASDTAQPVPDTPAAPDTAQPAADTPAAPVPNADSPAPSSAGMSAYELEDRKSVV